MLTKTVNEAIAFKEKGNLLFNQGSYANAISCYNQAIKIDIKLKEAWLNKALCHQKLNQTKAALNALTQAIIIDPLYVKAIYNKITLLIAMQNYQLAIETIDCYVEQGGRVDKIISLRKDCENKEVTQLQHKNVSQNKKVIHNLPKQGIEPIKKPSSTPNPRASMMSLLQQFVVAITSGNIAAVKTIIEAGIDINTLLPTGEFPQYLSYKMGESPDPFSMESMLGFQKAQPKLGESPLYLASSLGKFQIVDCLLSHNADVNLRGNYGLTALMVAISNGHVQVALRLLAVPNIIVDLAVQDGSTALSFACEKGLDTVVSRLISRGADIHHADEDGETPLIISITHKRSTTIELLLQQGADPNKCKPNGVSALFLAAQTNQLDILKRLISSGADLEMRRHFDQINPLLIAACQGSMDSVFYLLACGANQTAVGIDHRSASDYAKNNNHFVLHTHLIDYSKKHAIYLEEHKKGIVLFGEGDYQRALAIFESLSKRYLALYHQKISTDLAACFYSMAECHRELGQIEDAKMHFKKYYGIFLELLGEKNALTLQAKLKYNDFVRQYLSGADGLGAEINVETPREITEKPVLDLPREISPSFTPFSPSNKLPKSNYQPGFFEDKASKSQGIFNKSPPQTEAQARNIPILVAVFNKNITELKRLIQEKSNIDIHAPGGGKTALHLAVEMNHEEMVALLIEAKADVNVVTRTQKTPLHVAAQNGNTTIINRLLDAGAKINAACDVGCTPLHEAAANGHESSVVTLVTRGANIDLKDHRFNLTACQLAGFYNKNHIATILNPKSINNLVYSPAIAFIKTAFGEKYNRTVSWIIYSTQNDTYAKANMNFTLEKDAELYTEKLHAIGLIKAFAKKAEKGWELIVPHLKEVLAVCKRQEKPVQSHVIS